MDPHLEQGAALRHEHETGGAVSGWGAVLDGARRGFGVSQCLSVTWVREVFEVAVAFAGVLGARGLVLTHTKLPFHQTLETRREN